MLKKQREYILISTVGHNNHHIHMKHTPCLVSWLRLAVQSQTGRPASGCRYKRTEHILHQFASINWSILEITGEKPPLFSSNKPSKKQKVMRKAAPRHQAPCIIQQFSAFLVHLAFYFLTSLKKRKTVLKCCILRVAFCGLTFPPMWFGSLEKKNPGFSVFGVPGRSLNKGYNMYTIYEAVLLL